MKKKLVIFVLCLFFMGSIFGATTKDGYLAARTQSALDRAMEAYIHKDMGALKPLLKTGIVVMLKPGLEVFILDDTFGKVKIRIEGTNKVYWTVREAIKQ